MTSEATTSTGEITEADVEQYMTSLSNWGRWGGDDRPGTLNLITDEARLAAAQTIKTGRAVSLSRDIDPLNADPLGSGLVLVQRFMGLHEAGDHLEGQPARFDAVTEYVGISARGSSTHVDGLVHVTRGVLLDIAALHGVRWLDRGHGVRPEELEAAEAAQGVRVRSGDALLIHTGNVEALLAEGPDAIGPAARQAGLHASCLPFLRERDVAVLGNDGIQDVQPSGSSLSPCDLFTLSRSSPWACGSSTTCS
jgi:Putative cyclase